MSEIIFDEENNVRTHSSGKTRISKLTAWVMQMSGGRIKNESQARFVMILFIIFSASIIIILNFSKDDVGETVVEPPSGRVIEYPENGPPRLRP
jgi:hypothetical protein